MTNPAESGAAPSLGRPAHNGRVSLYGPDFAADPHSVYTQLRGSGPVAPVELAPGVPASLVTSYNAALEVLRSPETFPKDPRKWQEKIPVDSPVLGMMGYRPNCLYANGSDHARLRGAITDSLSRMDPGTLRAYVERHADRLIENFGGHGEADLLNDYAKRLPVLVFNELFGCPRILSEQLVEGMRVIFDGEDPERGNLILSQTMTELVTFKRKYPGADMTSWLMAHSARLTDEEMIHQLVVLMGAGIEPTQNLIANGMLLLLTDDRFNGDLSGGSLPVDDALNEILWTDPPMANYAVTNPVRDVDLAGTVLPESEPVVISIAAANNDPALSSEHRTGNRAHLAWSAGPHTCPAQSQARLISSVAIEKLLDGVPDMELAVPTGELEWRPGPFHRALQALPVRFPSVPALVRPDENGDGIGAAPTTSTRAESIYVPKQPSSEGADRQRWWSFLAKWCRGL